MVTSPLRSCLLSSVLRATNFLWKFNAWVDSTVVHGCGRIYSVYDLCLVGGLNDCLPVPKRSIRLKERIIPNEIE
jgi:hypothetical protein